MARITRKQLKQDEFVETAVEAGHWLERNWKPVAVAAGGAVVAVLAITFWVGWSSSRQEAARQQFGEALAAYRQAEATGFQDPGALESSLESFTAVEERLGSTPPGPVATYYRGLTLHQLGRAGDAVEALRQAMDAADTATLAGSAQAMLASVLSETGSPADAAALLEELAAGKNPVFPPSEALLRLGWVHADAGDQAAAREVWQRLLDEYPESAAAQQVTDVLGPVGDAAAAPAGS